MSRLRIGSLSYDLTPPSLRCGLHQRRLIDSRCDVCDALAALRPGDAVTWRWTDGPLAGVHRGFVLAQVYPRQLDVRGTDGRVYLVGHSEIELSA